MNGCIYRTEDNKCEFWSDHGKGIVSCCDFDDCEDRKPSNADRIRSMTDEELAELLEGKRPWYRCDNCKWDSCKECCLDWLKKEAED